MRFFVLLCIPWCAWSQSARYPAAIATNNDLTDLADRAQTTLTVPLNATATSFNVVTASKFAANMILTIDNEQIKICSVVGSLVSVGNSSCPNLDGRGFSGTAVASHANGSLVSNYFVAYQFKALREEVKAIEASLGTGLANVSPFGALGSPSALQVLRRKANGAGYEFANQPRLVTSDFNFPAQSPGGSLAAGNNLITLAPVPLGLNWNDPKHDVYVSGTGTAEPCTIVGAGPGTAVSGASSGTLTIACAGAHSAGWTIGSATAGAQEAVNVATAGNTSSPPEVYFPGGFFAMTGRLYLPPTKDFSFSSAAAILGWPTTYNADAILIDSCEDCQYHIPLMIYYGTGYAVHVAPNNPDPAGIPAFVDSHLWIADIGAGDVPHIGSSAAALYLDGTVGTIDTDDIFLGGTGGQKYGVLVAGYLRNSQITVTDMHDCTVANVADSTLSSNNVWYVQALLGSLPPSPSTVLGVSVSGTNSSWTIKVDSFAAGKGLVLNGLAYNNQIHAVTLNGYTNNSALGSYNRLFSGDSINYTALKYGYNVTTPAVAASGTDYRNHNLFPVVVTFLTAGASGGVLVKDQAGNVSGAGTPVIQGLQIYLDPEEILNLGYGSAPTWVWRGLR